MSMPLSTSVASHGAAIARGAFAATAYPIVYLACAQSLADYRSDLRETSWFRVCCGGSVSRRECQRDDKDDGRHGDACDERYS